MAKDCGVNGCQWAGKAHHNHDNDQYINRIEDDPSDGVKPEGHPALHNVTKLPGMGMRRARLFKNNMLDAVLGPEQLPEEPKKPEVESPVAESFGRNNNDFHEARIISMGKFKEDKVNRELMAKHDE